MKLENISDEFFNLRYNGYKPTKKLGEGFSSYVYLGEKGSSICAIKVPKKAMFYHMIMRGAETLLKLKGHPNIVGIHDNEPKGYSIHPELDFPFYMMEYLNGQNLKEVIAENAGAPLSIEQSVNTLLDLINAISCANSKKIFHGDIRPPNVFLLKDGRTKITDFDMARRTKTENTKEFNEDYEKYQHKYVPVLDRFGKEMEGDNVNFVPPYIWLTEQARKGNFSSKTDIYQLSKLFYYMITAKTVAGNAKPPSEIPRIGKEFSMLDEIVNKGMMDDENYIHIDLKRMKSILELALVSGDWPLFSNKIENFKEQFDFSLENIVDISIPKKINDNREIIRRTEQMTRETNKMLRNIRFLVTNYSDLIDFVHKKKMTSLSRVGEQINGIDTQMDQRMQYDARAMTKFINARTDIDELGEKQYRLYNQMDPKLTASFKDYLQSMNTPPKEIIQLASNASLIG